MAKRQTDSITVSDHAVRALLERYKCPVPFHQVRTRFLGNIASPVMGVSPIKMVQSLWGGELPPFDSLDEANAFIGALVMGLWNRLSRHQDRDSPFRLTRIQTTATRRGLAGLAQMRVEEFDGFIEGLFGPEEALDLPERAHRGLSAISEMRALFAAVEDVVSDESKPGTEKVQIRIEAGAAPEQLREIVARAVARCPVHEAAGRAVPVAVIVEVGQAGIGK